MGGSAAFRLPRRDRRLPWRRVRRLAGSFTRQAALSRGRAHWLWVTGYRPFASPASGFQTAGAWPRAIPPRQASPWPRLARRGASPGPGWLTKSVSTPIPAGQSAAMNEAMRGFPYDRTKIDAPPHRYHRHRHLYDQRRGLWGDWLYAWLHARTDTTADRDPGFEMTDPFRTVAREEAEFWRTVIRPKLAWRRSLGSTRPSQP